jgi:hypothetical protein
VSGAGQGGASDGDVDAAGIPANVRQRFWGYDPAALAVPACRGFLAARLMEEGSGEELRWLLAAVGREPLAALLASRGGRLLSRRSRAFWERVLGVPSAPPHPLAQELWPLA